MALPALLACAQRQEPRRRRRLLARTHRPGDHAGPDHAQAAAGRHAPDRHQWHRRTAACAEERLSGQGHRAGDGAAAGQAERVETFQRNYQQRFGGELAPCAPLAYDAAQVLIAAICQVDSPNPARIKAALHQIRFNGITRAQRLRRRRRPAGPALQHVCTAERAMAAVADHRRQVKRKRPASRQTLLRAAAYPRRWWQAEKTEI